MSVEVSNLDNLGLVAGIIDEIDISKNQKDNQFLSINHQFLFPVPCSLFPIPFFMEMFNRDRKEDKSVDWRRQE